MKKVFVVGHDVLYSKWIKDHQLVDSIEDADIVMFTGGEDVDPSLYGCERHDTTYSNIKRDLAEKAAFEQVKPHQLCIGICRGSQLMCVLNGGLLVQNVNRHATFGTHQITSLTSPKSFDITSTHHQMQYPFNLPEEEYDILYVAPRRSDYYEGDKIDIPPVEPEIVLYHKEGYPKCLAIQGHPEFMREDAPVIPMLNALIDRYVRS